MTKRKMESFVSPEKAEVATKLTKLKRGPAMKLKIESMTMLKGGSIGKKEKGFYHFPFV